MRRKKDRSKGITALYERLSRDDEMLARVIVSFIKANA